ncbi:MAG TPA: metallophosphoesterase [Sedimentisphaerales bacterium]|nr:metallophosphoesterase [Sedimentisphaerales bacterium]
MANDNWIITRRDFLKASALGIAGLSFAQLSALADENNNVIRFGIVTDPHYSDCDTPQDSSRFFKQSLDKMTECVELMNKEKVDFLIELGDFKDAAPQGNQPQTIEYIKTIENIFQKFQGPRYHVLGNHDVDCITKQQFLSNIKNSDIQDGLSYYSFDKNGVHFVVLDANYHKEGTEYSAGNFNWTSPNIPQGQLDWLKQDLQQAKGPAIIFIHQLLDGQGDVYVDNSPQVRQVLEDAGNVLAVFNGHHHEGQYSLINNIHYYTLKAMIEGSGEENNAYAIVELHKDDSLTVTGYRKAVSKELILNPDLTRQEIKKYQYTLPITVKGKVFMQSTGNPLSGIPITDGVNIVTTDAVGNYSIDVTQDPTLAAGGMPIISICVPSCKKTIGSWFKKINEIKPQENLDFALIDDEQNLPFTFIHCTDSHLPADNQQQFTNFRNDIDQLKDKVKFIFNTGDVMRLMDSQTYKEAKKDCDAMVDQLSKMSVPCFAVPGNHDLAGMRTQTVWAPGNPLQGYGLFTNFIGPLRFSFNYADIHFVGIDFNKFENNNWDWGVPETAVNWLEKDLKLVKPGTKIFLFLHYPQGHPKLEQVVKNYNITQIFHGHDHVVRQGQWAGIPKVSSGSLGYLFGSDVNDRKTGYRIVNVDKDGIDSFYREISNPHAINVTKPRFENIIEPGQLIEGEFYDPNNEIKKLTVKLGDRKEQVAFESGPVCCRFKTKLKLTDAEGGFRPLEVEISDAKNTWKYLQNYLTLTKNNPAMELKEKAALELEIGGVDVNVEVKLNDEKFANIAPTKLKGDDDFGVPVKDTEKIIFDIPAEKLRRLNKIELIAAERPQGKNDRFCILNTQIKIQDKDYRDPRYNYGAWSPTYISNNFTFWIDLEPGM